MSKRKAMIKIIIVMALVAVAAIVYKAIQGASSGPEERLGYEYKRRKFFMSRAEHECYNALMTAVGEKYHVFPQAHLPSVIDSKVVGQNWNGAFRHISQKSVDFVLCDKAYISPLLAIELDDRTHHREDRVERDIEVERILKSAGLPLLRLENHGSFNPIHLRELIEKALVLM